MTSSRWNARVVLLGIVACVAVVTGCAPESAPVSSASAAASQAQTPLVVIPASTKTYSNRGVVAWKVYPYLTGKTGGITVIGVDIDSNVKRVTRIFDVPGTVAGAPANLAYVPLYPVATTGRTVLGDTGLIGSNITSAANARHITDVLSDAQAYLPSATSQGSGCSTSVKRVVACLTAPSVGDLSSRWTQVRACRLAMGHLVKPTTCIQHSLKLAVPSASIKTKDGDDDDMAAGDDDDDTTNNTSNTTDTGSQNDTTNQAASDAQQDAQQDAQDDTTNTTPADPVALPGGTDDNTTAGTTAPAADDQPTDSNGLPASEASTAAGVDPIPSAGETATQASTTDSSATSDGCASTSSLHVLAVGATGSLHVLTNTCTAPASTNSTPVPTADQASFGAPADQATCSSGCAATQPAGTAATTQAQVPVPTTGGVTVTAGASALGLNANVSVTAVASDPGYVYVSVGAAATTQVAAVGVGEGPIVVRGDPQQVLTGTSVVSNASAGVGVVGGQIEVQTNQSGTTVSVTGQLGPSVVPAGVSAGLSYGWRIPVPQADPNLPLAGMGMP